MEVDTQGDAFLVAFADPSRALAAAGAAHAALAGHDWRGHPPIRVRIGVHTGTPTRNAEGYWGVDLHYGARLGSAGHGGQTLVSRSTATLVPDAALQSLGEHGFKDFTQPREIFHLVHDGSRADDFPPPRSLPAAHRLPALTASFVGRDDDLVELVRAMHGPDRVVTVIGAGGSGKTRLAIEAAYVLTAAFDDVWFVPLESVTDATELEEAICRILGLPDRGDAAARLRSHLEGRRALLVLDNVEHLLDAAPRIAALADAGPGVRILATSQAPLRVRAERIVRLAPLPLPGESSDPGGDAPSVRLLVERAHAVGVDLDASGPERADLEALVTRLEGMPLAIELAAGRLALLSPAALIRQLDRSLDALGAGARDLPPRQRGLRAVLDWSCSLLTAAQRDLLAGLACFGGDVDPELLDATFPGALDDLGALLDGGLVTRTHRGRVGLRPPVRRYAGTLVDDDTVRSFHQAVVTTLADLLRPFERRWLVVAGEGFEVGDPEEHNVLAALDWARQHDAAGHADLIAACGWWMFHLNLGRIGRTHVDVALVDDLDPVLRARLLSARGALAFDLSDPEPCLAAAEAWAALGDLEAQVVNLEWATVLMLQGGDEPGRVLEIARDAVALVEQHRPDDEQLLVLVRTGLAQALWAAGRRDEAVDLGSTLADAVDDEPWREFNVLTVLADFALEGGRPADALALFGRCMGLCREFGSVAGQLVQATAVTETLLALGRVGDATASWAICDHVHRELGRPRQFLGPLMEAMLDRLDDSLLPEARRRAAELGVVGGLAWVARVAAAGPTPGPVPARPA